MIDSYRRSSTKTVQAEYKNLTGKNWAVVIIAEGVLFAIVRRQSAPERRPGLFIAAWALAETVALYGGVYYFLTDEPRWYLWGVGFMLLSYFAFPIRRR